MNKSLEIDQSFDTKMGDSFLKNYNWLISQQQNDKGTSDKEID